MNFRNNFLVIQKSWLNFRGMSMYVCIALFAMIYIYLKEKDNVKKYFFIFYTLVASFLFINNPIFNKIIYKILPISTYWRMYWILPFGILMGYAAVKFIFSITEKKKKIIIIISLIGIIIISGKCVYRFYDIKDVEGDYFNYNFTKINNWYKIPDEVFEISKKISEDDLSKKMLMAPSNVVPYVRQYDATINLIYGRNPDEDFSLDIIEQLNSGNIKELMPELQDKKCNYIVIENKVELNEKVENYGFELLKKTETYSLYKLK